jgi:ERF superfamily
MPAQIELPEITKQMEIRKPSSMSQASLMDLLDYAVKNQSAIEVIKELRAMQMADEAKRAENEFNAAMELAQNEVPEIIPDCTNEQTGRKYASFKAMDRALRPIWKKHNFTLTFNAAPSPNPEEIYVICDVTHPGGCHKQYMIPMSTDGKGPKGGGVMSKQQGVVAATSYGRSTLLRLIFNLVIDDDGSMDKDELRDRIGYFAKCQTMSEVFEHFKASYMEAEECNDVRAQIALSEAKDKRKKEIENARAQR